MIPAPSTLYEPLTNGANGDWPMVPLGEVLIERQETPDHAAVEAGAIPIVAKIGFDSGRIELRNETTTRTKMILIQPGDLVASGINAAKGAIAVYGDEEPGPAAATIHYSSYQVRTDRADRSFIWWLLRSTVFRTILNHYLPGGIKMELKAKRLLPIPIPLPPLEEQRRIARKVDRLVAQVDDAHALRRMSCLESLALFRSRLRELANNLGYEGTLNHVLDGKPRNGWSARCDNMDGGTAVLTLSAVTGYLYDPTAIKRTSLPTIEHAHYWLADGDLLITRSNTPELVGHAAIYNGRPERCIYPDLMMRVPVNERLASKKFVWFWLQTPQVRSYIEANAKGTSPTMKKISQGIVMFIPFPTGLGRKEQDRIVEMLDGMQNGVDRLKSLQQNTAVELNAMLPSILDKAFKGEL